MDSSHLNADEGNVHCDVIMSLMTISAKELRI